MSTLTMLLHGDAGVGKSTLSNTSPAPRLILDAEGRAKYLPYAIGVVEWDPRNQSPPVADGTWDTCIAIVPDYQTMDLVYRWLQSGQHPFVSVIVDSLMEIQMRLIDQVAGIEQLKTQDWGDVLRQLQKLVRDYRDLVLSPVNTTQVVIFTVGSRDGNNGRKEPLLQGQMASKVPYFVDVVGYLYTTVSPEDPNNIDRALLVQPLPTAVAKDGTQRLPGPTIKNPNLSELYALLNGGAVQPQAAPVGSDQLQPSGGVTT